MLKKLLISTALTGGLCFPLCADPLGVQGVSKNLFRAMQLVARKAPDSLGPRQADLLKRGALADNQISLGEQGLLAALIAGNYEVLRISAEKSATFSPSDIEYRGKANQAAVAMLQKITPAQFNDPLEALFHSDVEGFKELLKIAQKSAADRLRVSKTLVRIIREQWTSSSWKDNYKSFRTFLSRVSAKNHQLSGPEYRAGKNLLYESILETNKQLPPGTGSKIQNRFFNHLAPDAGKKRREQERKKIEAYRKAKSDQGK